VLDHLDTFVVVPHNDFIFKFAADEVNVLKPYALPLADEAYRQYKERYGFTPKGPILIEVFDRHDDFAVRTIGLTGLEGALGSCFGRVIGMDSPKARPPGDFSWQATLWHEMAHVFTLQLSDYRVPRWLTEGISAYEEYRRNPAWGRELTLEFAHALDKKETFGVKNIARGFKEPAHLSMAYFEASLVVEHLVKIKGDAGLRTLLLAYAHGAKTDNEAFEQAYGQGIDQVEASYDQFIQDRYHALSVAMTDPKPDVEDTDVPGLRSRAAAQPGNFTSQILYGRAFVKAGDQPGAVPSLEKAAALAPQAMGEGSPHGLLARIAENAGDSARARREWRALLLYDHTDIDGARRLLTLAQKDKADDDENYALRLIADLDPFDADIHVELGRRLLATQPAAALIEFQANTALGPKNPAEAHSDVADALLKLGRKDEAKTEAMLALKDAPSYARAQDLLLAAMGR
jgi:tetratricopeptide (TPR) repeat protein